MKYFKLLPLIFIFSLLIISCSKKNDQAKMIPKEAAIVIELNTKSLLSKLSWDEIKKSYWYNQLLADSALPATKKAMIEDPRHDILFVGYQARGTPGRAIQEFGRQQGYVELDGVRCTIRARVHTVSGYSAHADQKDLIRFITGITRPPREIRVIHGDEAAKATLQNELKRRLPDCAVLIPRG